MSHGHQIIKVRQGKKRRVPDWVDDDDRLQKVLLTSFPNMLDNQKQRDRAGRWARIFYMYYKGNYTARDIAQELDMTIGHVRMILVGIRRVANGGRYDGKLRVGKLGRPKKLTQVCLETPLGTKENSDNHEERD